MAMKLTVCVDANGTLRIVPHGGWHPLPSLNLIPVGAVVSAAGCAPVTLPWDAYGELELLMDVPRSRDGWAVSAFASTRNGPTGIAIRIGRTFEPQTRPLLKATSSRLRRLKGWSAAMYTGKAIPLLPTVRAVTAERDTINALCRVLKHSSTWRDRLNDRDRMSRLAGDVTSGRIGNHRGGGHFGRHATDIQVAMQAAGLIHPFGRPLDPSQLPSLEAAVDAVATKLESNPYRQGRATDRADIERAVRRDFLDIAPWPFQALVGG